MWGADLDEWRTHHPDWGVTRSERDLYCLSKFEGEKATFFRRLYELQWGMAVAVAADGGEGDLRTMVRTARASLRRRDCPDLLQKLRDGQVDQGHDDGIVMAFESNRPYQLNKLRSSSRWMYATNDTSSWGFCNTTDLNCYILPIGNCLNTYCVNDPIDETRSSMPNYKWMYEYLMRFNHRAMYHIQWQMNDTSNIEKLDGNCTVIHVRRGDSGIPIGSSGEKFSSNLTWN